MRATLHRATLHYGGGLLLHTASSGPVPGLDTLYLRLEHERHVGIGEVRINIAYLNGISPETCVEQAMLTLGGMDWSKGPAALQSDLAALTDVIAPVRMLIDIALHDLTAREQGVTVCSMLGAPATSAVRYATNQTLFISTAERFLAQAETYVTRGFRDLKVRVAPVILPRMLRGLLRCARVSETRSSSPSTPMAHGPKRKLPRTCRRLPGSGLPMSSSRLPPETGTCCIGWPKKALCR